MATASFYLHTHKWNRPALVDVVHSQRAEKEDKQNRYEHVVDGPDVADLKQFTNKEENM